ncbi:hypothetical protein C9975_03075 [Thalassospira xiamenensis]|nr:hypothetical protein C9975_03075 [Thalassospira xiamenensis]
MGLSIKEAEANLAAAEAAYKSEVKADSTRTAGSGAQEQRREKHQEQLLDRIEQCKQDLLKAQEHTL